MPNAMVKVHVFCVLIEPSVTTKNMLHDEAFDNGWIKAISLLHMDRKKVAIDGS